MSLENFVQQLTMRSGPLPLLDRLFWTTLATYCVYLLATGIQSLWYVLTGKVYEDEDE